MKYENFKKVQILVDEIKFYKQDIYDIQALEEIKLGEGCSAYRIDLKKNSTHELKPLADKLINAAIKQLENCIKEREKELAEL